jgi:hypothetical protein
MNQYFKLVTAIFLGFSLLNISCRQEEYAFEGTPPDQSVRAGAVITNLLQDVALNDGSVDNILDGASCFTLELPLTILIDEEEIVVNDKSEYAYIEILLENAQDSVPTLVFPITIIEPDYTSIIVTTEQDLQDLANGCGLEDDDIECVDLEYPVVFSSFNSISEKLVTDNITDDEMLYEFINSIEDTDLVEISFPLNLVLTDGTIFSVTDLDMMQETIESFKDGCDEDDDNDFDDDDCTNCNQNEVEQIWTSCVDWSIQIFRLDLVNLLPQYSTMVFSPTEDGNITVTSDTETFNGTWTMVTDDTGNTVTLTLNITGLDDFNGDWLLNEATLSTGVSSLNFRRGNSILLFQGACD